MKRILMVFIARAAFPAVLLGCVFFSRGHPLPLQWIGFLLLTGAMWPTLSNAAKRAAHAQFDVGVSMAFTIYVLVYVNAITVAAVFVLIMIAGDLFKAIILYKVRQSLERITVFLPHTGFVKSPSGEVKEIEIAEIAVGDTVVVEPGGRAPADGTLLAETALLDESVISGESRPIAVAQGGEVPAGSINAGDYFEMRAARVGENSTVAQIRKIAEEAGREKTPIARFIDEYAKYTSLVVAVLVIALYLFTGDLFRALGLWIAMVPIVFAIIGPVSVSIGVSTAARMGILIKGAETIEDLTKIRHAVFDKTGTLTAGTPSVREIMLADGKGGRGGEDALLSRAGGMEKKSEHEIAKAIVREAAKRNIATEEFAGVHVVKGGGLTAERGSDRFTMGSEKFLKEQGVALPPEFRAAAAEREGRGETPVFVAQNGALIGAIFVADFLRPEAAQAIRALKEEGYDLRILTGDDIAVARHIAGLLGLPEPSIAANLSPEDKIACIREFEKKGERSIMVGDGINDAPALSAATAGIAMGVRGTDLATNAASVVLVEENLMKIPRIIGHSKRVIAVIKEDLVGATAIHAAAGLFAALGMITLLQTALFHEASSVLVLANTARLFSVRREPDSALR